MQLPIPRRCALSDRKKIEYAREATYERTTSRRVTINPIQRPPWTLAWFGIIMTYVEGGDCYTARVVNMESSGSEDSDVECSALFGVILPYQLEPYAATWPERVAEGKEIPVAAGAVQVGNRILTKCNLRRSTCCTTPWPRRANPRLSGSAWLRLPTFAAHFCVHRKRKHWDGGRCNIAASRSHTPVYHNAG